MFFKLDLTICITVGDNFVFIIFGRVKQVYNTLTMQKVYN